MPKGSTNTGDLIRSLDSLAIQDEGTKQLVANFLGFDLLPLQNKHSEKPGTTTKRKDLNEIDITPPPSEDKEKKPPQNTSTTNIPRKDLNEKTPTNSTPSTTHQTIPSTLNLIEENTKKTSLTFFIDGKLIEPEPLKLQQENFGIENLNIVHLQSLFDPDSINDTIAWSVANYKSSSQIDIDLLVEKISKREDIKVLPTLKILSIPHTLQLLVDISDVMTPYKQDQDIVIEKVKQILGEDSVKVIRFKKYPHFSDVYFESEHKHKPYTFPDAKTTILLLTDLGIGQSSLSSPTNNEWESFACLAKEIECPLVAYVPFQENLWPETLKDKIKIIYWDRNNPKHPIYERKSKNKINQKLEQKNNDKALKNKLTLEEQLLELLTEKNPFLVELAKTLSLAAKIEPALLRYFRLKLFPNLEAGIETKLWSSELVQSGSDSEIIFFPKVAQLLRNLLAKNPSYLDICWNKLTYFRKQYNSPYLLRLEELINYLSLKKSNFNDLKQLFFRIIKTITENSKHNKDVSRWAFSIIPKLDKQIAKNLPIEELLYSISLNLHIPITKKFSNINLDKFRSILPSNLAKINLGINLTHEGIEFGLAHNYNHYIEVSKTNPIILNIKNEKEEKKSIELFISSNNLTPNFHKIYGNRFHIETIDGKIYELKQDLLKSQKQRLNEVKMLVVGEGKVGKTSLVNRLVDNIFNDPEPMIEGVIIKKHWPVKLSDEREIKVNIWDFGGQEIMHSTHQFFLTKRSLYLLVLDAKHDEQQNRLDYWLKTIVNFADDAPIIIVYNQIDIKSLELDRKGLKSKYPNIKKFVEVSCKTTEGIDLLKETIVQEISQLKHIDDLLPSSWFKIKEQLETLQNQHKDYLEYNEYHQMCEQETLDSLSEETLIGFLHDLGTVLCFHKDLRLRDTHILNPAWVTEGVYKILNYRGLAIDKGELKVSSLNQILNNSRYPRNKHIFIIEMMRKFELCFDLENSNREKLLIPDLLPKESPNLADLEHWNDSLRFEYHYDLLPSSVISRFIVRMNAFIYDKTYWRYGVVLISEDKFNKALVKADLDTNKIFIFVDGRADSRKDLLSLIRADFLKIHDTLPKVKETVKEKIPIPDHPKFIVDHKHLLTLKKMRQETFVPEGMDEPVSVIHLLEGIEVKTNVQDNIHILHLSDIHLSTITQSNIYYNQLELDLTQNLKLETLNYLLISGDIANTSAKEEYGAAFNLIKQIKERFNLGNDQIVLVPGNHDLNWELSATAYQYIPKFELPEKLTDDYIEIPNDALLRDEERYRKRFDNFCDFYLQVTGKNYPTNYDEQAVLHIFREHKILVLGLNSAWQIDHNYTNRAGIHQVALGKTLGNINSNDYQDWLKIAIWHHPITGQEIMNADFLEQLAVAGFEVCLHGHIHEPFSSFYNYDSNRGLHIIGGGKFSIFANKQATSISLQYNLLVLEPGTTNLTVKIRRKEKVDGAWSAHARWSDKESPKADYTIHVKNLIPYPLPSSDSVNKTILFRYETAKVDNKGKIIERHKKEGKQYIEDLENGVVLEMVEVPSGEFMMGSPDGKGYDSETPPHKVTVPTFYMGKYQVTQEQWETVMGSNPSRFKENGKLPVETVSWNDAIEFCKRLSEKTNKIYRLPSEAEWEYACRAGTETPFAFGETINTDIVNYDGNNPYREGLKGEYRRKTTVVGSLGVANNFGLYDMHGNVWEWCQDAWHDSYNGAPTDGSVWDDKLSNNTYRVLRGGSYYNNAVNCRSALRDDNSPDTRYYLIGLRLVMAARTLK